MSQIRTLDEFERRFREGIGVPLPLRPWRTMSEEYAWRFGDGVGDHNPLYRDPAYARNSRFHSLMMHPAFVMTNGGGMVPAIWGNMRQHDVSTEHLTMLYAGAEVEWYEPVFAGDKIRVIESAHDVKRISTRQIEQALLTTGEAQYWNQRSQLVARVLCQMIRFENEGLNVESTHDQDEDGPTVRIAPDPLVWQRERRGGTPRFWEDVTEGESIPELPKGTYTQSELYLFSYGAGGTNRVPQMAEGTIDMGAGGRADPEYARKHRAQATTFDYGFQRISWLIQAATDWMGDHGELVRLTSRITRPNLLFDTNTITGRVKRTYAEDGRHYVDLELANHNQRDVVTATAVATVALPRAGELPDHSLLFSETGPIEAGIYG